jgi:hypothetical protein
MLPAMGRVDIDPLHLARSVAVEHDGATANGLKLLVANDHQDQRGFRQRSQIEQMIAFGGIEFALIAVKRRNQLRMSG